MLNDYKNMRIINIAEAKVTLSKLVDKVMDGEEVIIGQAGKPVAKLVSYHYDSTSRELGVGSWRGHIWVADDFDDTHVFLTADDQTS